MGVVAAGAALAIAACGGDSGQSTASTTAAPVATTTSTPTTAATTTSVTVPQAPAPSVQAAADALLGAWRAGNQLAALTAADKAAVDVLFAIPPETGEARGCNASGADPSYCVYRLSAGELQLRVSKRGDGWIVSNAILGS
jgi:hypothetical protein